MPNWKYNPILDCMELSSVFVRDGDVWCKTCGGWQSKQNFDECKINKKKSKDAS